MIKSSSRETLKSFFKRFIPVAVILFAVSFWGLFSQRNQYVDLVKDHELSIVKSSVQVFSKWLEFRVEDVEILANLVEDHLNVESSQRVDLDAIARILEIFGADRKACVQLRYLSPAGMELVRINVDKGQPKRVADEFLQDKGNRPYIKDIPALSESVYISCFDLNQEYGKIEVPYVPILRFVRGVFGKSGVNYGYVVISFAGEESLNYFRKSSGDSFGNLLMVNDAGGWILGPDDDYSWQFLFKNANGFMQDAYPEVWESVAKSDSGQLLNDGRLFTFNSVGKGSFPHILKQDVIFKEGWKIVSMVPGEALVVPRSNITFVLIAGLYFIIAYLFWRQHAAVASGDQVRKALLESEKRFMDVADAAGEFIWETGPDGNFVFVTGRVEDVLGFSAEELIGRSPFDFVDEESSWEVRKEFLDAAQFGNSFSGLEFKFVNRDGRKIWLEFNGVPVFGDEGFVTGFRGATSDISAQKKALQDLQDREDMLQSISDSVQDALILMDEKGLVHFWNPAAEKIFGYSAAEMLGESLQSCFLAEDNTINDSEEGGDYLDGLLSGYGSFTVNARRKRGDVFPAEVLLSPLKKDDQWWVVGTIRDVTERKEAEDKLRKLATTDPLTGLSNRRFFMESAEDALARSRRYERELSLLMLDIDYFKTVNDMYGHDAGDDVLKGLASTGLSILRNIDVFGRIGGEEFSVLLPDTGLEGARLVAERLRAEIGKTKMMTRSGELSITVSIGVATINEQTRTLEHLLKAADIGLYAAKEAGRNLVKVQLSPKTSDDS